MPRSLDVVDGSEPAVADRPGFATCELRVGGMDCASCAASVERALKSLEGVQDVRVDVIGGKVRVGYAEGKLARGDLAGTITRLGYVVQSGDVRRAAFVVEKMDCADEVRLIEAKLGRLPGVTKLEFDVVRRRLVVQGAVTAPEVQRAVQELGMAARPEGEVAAPVSFWARRGRLVLTSVAGALLALGVGLECRARRRASRSRCSRSPRSRAAGTSRRAASAPR